jgi:putative ATP-dependent endonuclease of the OLD family
MYLSRISIENFRNFASLDVTVNGNVVIVGENRIGKTNLLHALRLLFDPTLPDSARQLRMADFRDGLAPLDANDKILVAVEIKDFESDLDVPAVLTDLARYASPRSGHLLRAVAEDNRQPAARP